MRATRESDYVMTEQDRECGFILTCCHTADTDTVLEAAEALTVSDLPQQEIRAHVRKLEALSPDLILLHVQTPRTRTLRFMAGQRVDLELESGAASRRPIASCPCNGRNLQFVIRRRADDPFTAMVFGGLRSGQGVWIRGPQGEFVLQEGLPDPARFLALDDGFAPIKSLIEHAISIDAIESFHLYWLARGPEGQYMDRLCRSWRDSLDNFQYTPITAADPSQVIDRIAGDHADPRVFRYYLSGPGEAMERVRVLLPGLGIPPERIQSDEPAP